MDHLEQRAVVTAPEEPEQEEDERFVREGVNAKERDQHYQPHERCPQTGACPSPVPQQQESRHHLERDHRKRERAGDRHDDHSNQPVRAGPGEVGEGCVDGSGVRVRHQQVEHRRSCIEETNEDSTDAGHRSGRRPTRLMRRAGHFSCPLRCRMRTGILVLPCIRLLDVVLT
jgi:hypothetical protein